MTRCSQSVYETAAPRGHVGVLVGNELHGIPKRVLKTADQVVSIPMAGGGMSSVNVAVAGPSCSTRWTATWDASDCGHHLCPGGTSMCWLWGHATPVNWAPCLPSAWAFGWQRVFLDDRHGVWFTTDRPTLLASRAAARREVNRRGVPHEQLNLGEYLRVLICDGEPRATPLSRCSLPAADRVLLVFSAGSGNDQSGLARRLHGRGGAGIRRSVRVTGHCTVCRCRFHSVVGRLPVVAARATWISSFGTTRSTYMTCRSNHR